MGYEISPRDTKSKESVDTKKKTIFNIKEPIPISHNLSGDVSPRFNDYEEPSFGK